MESCMYSRGYGALVVIVIDEPHSWTNHCSRPWCCASSPAAAPPPANPIRSAHQRGESPTSAHQLLVTIHLFFSFSFSFFFAARMCAHCAHCGLATATVPPDLQRCSDISCSCMCLRLRIIAMGLYMAWAYTTTVRLYAYLYHHLPLPFSPPSLRPGRPFGLCLNLSASVSTFVLHQRQIATSKPSS